MDGETSGVVESTKLTKESYSEVLEVAQLDE